MKTGNNPNNKYVQKAMINAVREFSSLWLVNSKSYKDQRAQENACKMVSSASGFAVETCTKKWKNLRDKFVKELRKVTVRHSGDKGPPATSSWKFFNIMYFLKDMHCLPQKVSLQLLLCCVSTIFTRAFTVS